MQQHACVLSRFSGVHLFATLWTIAHRAPLSMGILQARILERVALPSQASLGFPGSSAGKESTCNAGDLGSIPGSRRSPGGRHGNTLLPGESPWTEEPGGL